MEYPKKLRALKDYPNSGRVKKGEIGIHIEGRENVYSFPSQNPYSVEMEAMGTKYEVVIDEPTYEIY